MLPSHRCKWHCTCDQGEHSLFATVGRESGITYMLWGKRCVPGLETWAVFLYRAFWHWVPIQEGYGEGRHFCAKGSWHFMKEELMRNHVGSYRRRGIQGTCFWELFCWITATKPSETTTFAVFLLINWNNWGTYFTGSTEVFFLHSSEPAFPGRRVHLGTVMQNCAEMAKLCPNNHALKLEGAYFYQLH